MEFLLKNNKRACSFIRDLRVQGQNEQFPPMTKIALTYLLNLGPGPWVQLLKKT